MAAAESVVVPHVHLELPTREAKRWLVSPASVLIAVTMSLKKFLSATGALSPVSLPQEETARDSSHQGMLPVPPCAGSRDSLLLSFLRALRGSGSLMSSHQAMPVSFL